MKKIKITRKKSKKDEGKGEKIMMAVLEKCAEISTDTETSIDNEVITTTRKSLNEIRKGVLERRKHFENYVSISPIIYDATIENDFFKHMKEEIYKNILEAEGDED